jgi:hypothetical protein
MSNKKESSLSAEQQTLGDCLATGHDLSLPPNHPINALSKWRKMGIVISLSYAGMLTNFSIAIANVAFG